MAFLDIIFADQHTTFRICSFPFSSHSLVGFIFAPEVAMDTNTSDPHAQYFHSQFPTTFVLMVLNGLSSCYKPNSDQTVLSYVRNIFFI